MTTTSPLHRPRRPDRSMRADEKSLYGRHLDFLDRVLAEALASSSFEAVLFHAGRDANYFADDQTIPFRATPHFRRYVPLTGPDHSVLARPGHRPRVIRVAPKDFWYETLPLEPSYWQDHVDLVEVDDVAGIKEALGPQTRVAYVGPSAEFAATLGIADTAVQPQPLLSILDWHRATKTEHELRLIEIACRRGADGHRVARKAFESGGSERQIHWAYLEATGHLEAELPFEAIVARGSKIAILHYQNKRNDVSREPMSFMLDAGASCDGYASDITRTWFAEDSDAIYAALVRGMDELQRSLVAMVEPGRDYVSIQREAHAGVARLLVEAGIARTSPEDAWARGLTRTFLPHGVGHHLGIQVHDVGGRQAGPAGGHVPPPPEFPALRTTRALEAGHVVTIEPGLYFAPVLLDSLRAKPESSLIDWRLVERLAPWGGVRIEDDVLCTENGPRDLTRALIAGPRGM